MMVCLNDMLAIIISGDVHCQWRIDKIPVPVFGFLYIVTKNERIMIPCARIFMSLG